MRGRIETCRQHASPRAVLALALLASVLTQGAAATKPAGKVLTPNQQEISYDAASVDVDYKTNAMTLKDVVITYGTMTVRADIAHATARDDFKNSHWTFDGNVRINADPRGNLRSDEAVVEFRDNQLVKATATGKPAEFEQKRAESNQVARGHAAEIVYDVNDGTIRLSNDAWLSDGQNEITSQVLVYNLREEHVQAITAPGTGERVHITIAPREKPAVNGPNKPHGATPQP
jgi:lipopolysaccharide transport protein LptA